MNMKKWLLAGSCIAMLGAFSACSDDPTSADPDSSSSGTSAGIPGSSDTPLSSDGGTGSSSSVTPVSSSISDTDEPQMACSEIMYNAPGGSPLEWVEVYIAGGMDMDNMQNFFLHLSGAVDYTFPAEPLKKGEYVVITNDLNLFKTTYPDFSGRLFGPWDAAGKLVNEGDVVVANNTKVFPALLYGEKEKTGAKITVFLQRELNKDMRLWDVIVDPARKIRIGNKLYFGPNESLVAEVIDNTTSRGRTVRFLFDGTDEEFNKHIRSLGHTPLPDELQRLRNIENWDAERYQTIYAKVEGAVAAPIAGLHISREMMKRFEINDIIWQELTLHCGIGNFKDIEVEDLSKHRMDAEEMHLSQETCDVIMNAKNNGNKICIIGTTTMRAIESAVTIAGKVSAYDGWTNKFIFPPYNFTIADMMVTNFHHPKSSQYIMASAFGGMEFVSMAYESAIREKYKFSTYGDAMLIL